MPALQLHLVDSSLVHERHHNPAAKRILPNDSAQHIHITLYIVGARNLYNAVRFTHDAPIERKLSDAGLICLPPHPLVSQRLCISVLATSCPVACLAAIPCSLERPASPSHCCNHGMTSRLVFVAGPILFTTAATAFVRTALYSKRCPSYISRWRPHPLCQNPHQ